MGSQAKKQRQRSVYIDSAGGLLLAYMIIYHCALYAGCGETFISDTVFFSFFMQWFFFKAGMFFSPRPISEIAIKSSRRLLLPWAVFNIAGMVIYLICQLKQGTHIDTHYLLSNARTLAITGSTRGNPPLWFLPSLYCVRLLYAYIYPRRGHAIYIIMLYMIPLTTHYVLRADVSQSITANIPYYLYNIPTGLLFYALGHRLKHYNPNRIMLPVLAAAYIIVLIVWPTYLFVFDNKLLMGYYPLSPICALAGIIIINAIFKHIADRTNLLSRIGADTMPYYCLHWLIIMAISLASGDRLTNNSSLYLMVLAVGNALLLPVLTYLIKRTPLRSVLK